MIGVDNLVAALNDLNWCKEGFNGPVPLEWTDIRAYMRLTNAPYDAIECGAIIATSRAFVRGFRDKRRADPAFWDEYHGLLMPLSPADRADVKVEV